MGNADYVIRVSEAPSAVNASAWDALLFSQSHPTPFMRHAYLAALHDSGSATPATGWRPHFFTLHQGAELAGACVVYLKDHSYGEYVFDWAWAQAYERHGLEYYPKLLNAIPFTPVQGRRMGLSPTLSTAEIKLLGLVVLSCLNGQLANVDTPMSSWHSLFVSSSQQALFTEASNHTALRRLSTQFHWHNRGYADFAAFLAALTSRKRKNILKERAQLQPYGLQYEFVAGAEISSQQWQHFIECYQLTYLKRSGHRGYLTPTFFNMIAERLAEQYGGRSGGRGEPGHVRPACHLARPVR